MGTVTTPEVINSIYYPYIQDHTTLTVKGWDSNFEVKCLLNCWSLLLVFKRYPSTYC